MKLCAPKDKSWLIHDRPNHTMPPLIIVFIPFAYVRSPLVNVIRHFIFVYRTLPFLGFCENCQNGVYNDSTLTCEWAKKISVNNLAFRKVGFYLWSIHSVCISNTNYCCILCRMHLTKHKFVFDKVRHAARVLQFEKKKKQNNSPEKSRAN